MRGYERMRYNFDYNSEIKLAIQPQEYSKDSEKEILQYAVGALLYMPASNLKIVDKIVNKSYTNVNSIVLDLEDSLGDDMVTHGQRTIKLIAQRLVDAINANQLRYEDLPLIFIRIREHGQMKEVLDSLGENIKVITGFNIPKFDKDCCNAYISEFIEVRDEVNNRFNNRYKLYLMPIIENKLAMYRQLRMDNLLKINSALRPISDNVLNIRVGGADFCSIFGIRRGIDECIHDIGVVRSVFADILNVFGKNYVVSGPVWEYFGTDIHGAWATGLKNELKYDKLNGFIGKTSIHPQQLPLIQESLIVKWNDYQDALNILGMNMNTTGVKKSTDDGLGNCRMNEVKTHTNWAKKIINLATVYGVYAPNEV
jgi:citrate lyase beta subunit